MTDTVENARQLALTAVNAIWEKKGYDVVVIRVREIVQYTDYMVIASARNERQAVAIADNVEKELREKMGQKAIGEEGRRTGRWVLVDYSDIVVHIFHSPVRAYYELERLFADAPRLQLDEPAWVHEISPEEGGEAPEYDELVWQGAKWEEGDDEALVDEDADSDAEDEEFAEDDDETADEDDDTDSPTVK